MLTEACFIVLGDDIAVGKDPLDRRAPESFWSELYKICREGETREFSTLKRAKCILSRARYRLSAFVCRIHAHSDHRTSGADDPQPLMIPLTWAEPATTQARCC